jgi:hypothetical protein
MQIGLSSIIADGFGSAKFSFDGITTISIPPAGTILSTSYGINYINGAIVVFGAVVCYYQTCDANVIADGIGGSYIDYANAVNITYKPNATYIGNVVELHNISFNIEINGNYYPQQKSGSYDIYADGIGSYYTENAAPFSFIPVGTIYTSTASQNEIPPESGNYYNNGFVTNYLADGAGWYTTASGGTADAYGTVYVSTNVQIEVPSGSGNYFNNGALAQYIANGFGGYTLSAGGSFTPYGTVYTSAVNQTEVPSGGGIYYNNGTSTSYIANGSGGYTTQNTGSYYSSGTLITQTTSSESGEAVYIDDNYFYPQWTGYKATWNGSGGYDEVTTWYKPYGTQFYATYYYVYFWDGAGWYYTEYQG